MNFFEKSNDRRNACRGKSKITVPTKMLPYQSPGLLDFVLSEFELLELVLMGLVS